MQVRDSVAVVTGAADGMGKAIATELVAAGARAVVVSDLDLDRARQVADTLGPRAFAVRADVGRKSDIADLVAETTGRAGPIDIFVSNAGLTVTGGYDVSDANWQRAMDVNFMAHVWAARLVVPGMLERGRGHLLQNIAAAGVLTAFGCAPYSAAKHAATGFAESLAVQYGHLGLGVSCLMPQAVNTPMLAQSVGSNEALARLKSFSKVLEPEEVATMAVAGIEANAIHIYTHEDSIGSFRSRADDPDAWIAQMRDMMAGRAT